MHRVLAPILVLILSNATAAWAKLEVSKYPRVYKGSEGVEVTVVALMPKEAKKALVKVTGIDTDIDGVVLLHEESTSGSESSSLVTYVNDDKFWTLGSRESWWGWKNLQLTLPEARTKKIGLWYDEELSKKVDGGGIASQYEKQLADGTIAKVQAYKGSDPKPHAKRTFKEAVDGVEGECGIGISAVIDWAGLSEAQIKSVPVATRCRVPAEILNSLCKGDRKAAVAKKVSGITCKFASSAKLELSGDKTLVWQTTPNSVDHDQLVRDRLASVLK